MHSAVLCVHNQISQDYSEYRDFFQDSKAGSIINSQKSWEISWAATHVI